MATHKKFLAFSFILALVLVLATGFLAFAKTKPISDGKQVETASVTGVVVENITSDGMQFLRITPTDGGEDVWVAVFGEVSVGQDGENTFEGPVYKNYNVKILKRKFNSIIFSTGPQ